MSTWVHIICKHKVLANLLSTLIGMSRAGRAALSDYLKGLRQKLPYDAEYAAIQQQRGKLPAAAMKQQLLEALEQHQVGLVIYGGGGVQLCSACTVWMDDRDYALLVASSTLLAAFSCSWPVSMTKLRQVVCLLQMHN